MIDVVQLPPDNVDSLSDLDEIDENILDDFMPPSVVLGNIEFLYNPVESDSDNNNQPGPSNNVHNLRPKTKPLKRKRNQSGLSYILPSVYLRHQMKMKKK